MTTAYPLAWPPGWPRTMPRQPGLYKTPLSTALNNLRRELRMLCGDAAEKSLVLSSNYTLGNDHPADPGVVAYFTWDRVAMAVPCDRWSKIEHNVQAIALTFESMRAMDRHGARHMIKAMFQGFRGIAAPEHFDWRAILAFKQNEAVTVDAVQQRRRDLAARHHPDRGGNPDQMASINRAADAALAELRA